MKTGKKRGLLYRSLLVFILLAGLVVAVQPGAYAKSVPYWEKFDINSFTGKRITVSTQSRTVPNNAYWSYTTTDKISSGWNYNRYITLLHYYDSSTKKYYH
ncbi:hypothetical protein [Listeria booriae]|uniref:hypothetical protein n=1 Tax=Listeria booriae TaxID=1552123 RepID=UPI00162A5129|nr:hypothetical protein [Listeria booriae]MBC2161865.1 hypothetical protein [Listeria booriae]